MTDTYSREELDAAKLDALETMLEVCTPENASPEVLRANNVSAAKAIQRLRERVAKLEAALLPFARAAERYDECERYIRPYDPADKLTVADLFAARDELKEDDD